MCHRTIGILGMVSIIALGAGSCRQNAQGFLYRSERAIWKARRLEMALRIGPETPPTSEELDRVRRSYEDVLHRFPVLGRVDGPDSAVARGISRARAQAQMGLVRIHRAAKRPEDALRILQEAHDDYSWNPSISLPFYQVLIDELQAAGQLDQAARICQEVASSLPARTAAGRPIEPVQDAPLRAADLFAQAGLKEEALLELDRAEIYYRAIVDENPQDEAAVLAWIQLSAVESRRGRFAQAEESLTRARSSPAPGLQPRVLFILGVLQQEGRRDPAAASTTFQEMAARFPESPAAPEALARQAACLAELGRGEEALALLRKVREQYPRDAANGALALLLGARILTRLDRWNEALSEYRALQTAYPRSSQAIGSPFEIADHYRRTGAQDAFRATLERAIADGDLLRDEHAGTPLARMVDEASIRALMELARWNEAVERLLRFPTVYPDDPRNPVSLIEAAAILSERLGERERAAVVLESVAERYPDSRFATQAHEQAQRLRSR